MSLRARLGYAAVQIAFVGTMAMGCLPDVNVPDSRDDEEDDLISTSDPQALTEVLVIPGATLVSGSIPSTGASSTSSPTIAGGSSLSVTSGGQAVLDLEYSSSTGYQNCYVQVRGANSYFRISGDQAATSGRIQIPVTIPANVNAGSFSFNTAIAGAGGLVSNILSTSISVSRSTSTPTTSTPTSTGATCSGVQTVGSCRMEFCIQGNNSSCWYSINSRKFSCSSCQNVNACAQAAGTYLANSCY